LTGRAADENVDVTGFSAGDFEHLARGHIEHTPMYDRLTPYVATPPQRFAAVVVPLDRNSGPVASSFEAKVKPAGTREEAYDNWARLGHVIGFQLWNRSMVGQFLGNAGRGIVCFSGLISHASLPLIERVTSSARTALGQCSKRRLLRGGLVVKGSVQRLRKKRLNRAATQGVL
jgi:hypothetical protein